MPLHVVIKAIPHSEQRYETVGDYVYNGDRVYITVSDMGNRYKEAAVALHEFVEMMLCRLRGIEEPDIAAFDMQYEKNRDPLDLTSEPGDDPQAPYRKEHRFAENIERLFVQEMGMDWHEYEKTVLSLSSDPVES